MRESFSIVQHDRFDLADFLSRWDRARLSVLKKVSEKFEVGSSDMDLIAVEICNVSRVDISKRDFALRDVFDHSRAFGLSFVKNFGLSLEKDDLKEILSQSFIPCTRGNWSQTKTAWVVKRSGCSYRATSFVCDWFREAIDGLVMGVGQEERFARHGSEGHGDEECVDVYFAEPLSFSPSAMRFGPVPEAILQKLIPIQEWFKENNKRLSFHGFSEQTLFYKLESFEEKKPLCGASARIFQEKLYKSVHEHFPSFRMQDLTPLAVYAEGTK